jgi:2-C-methyl-D-erythritol 4-phosphate cytidylyltransferase
VHRSSQRDNKFFLPIDYKTAKNKIRSVFRNGFFGFSPPCLTKQTKHVTLKIRNHSTMTKQYVTREEGVNTMKTVQDTTGILVCAGNATRMQGQNKILLPLGKTNVIGMSMSAMEQCDRIAEFIIVARPCDQDAIRQTVSDLQLKKCSAIVSGGATRQESVWNGIRAASKETKLFAIHDGARPLVKPEQIAAVIQDATVFGGATLGVPVKDTIKVVNDGLIVDTPYRPHLYITQTPQVFQKRIYFEAVDFAQEHNLDFTDDCQLAEAIGCKVYMTVGDYTNIKITTPEDIFIAQLLLEKRMEETV